MDGEISFGGYQVIEEEPEFGLFEFGFLSVAVIDLLAEEIGVVFEVELCYKRSTVRVPLEPQRPLEEKDFLVGRSR